MNTSATRPANPARVESAISFTVEGVPIAQPRARTVRTVGSRGVARSFTPDKDGLLAAWKQKVMLRARSATAARTWPDGVALSLSIEFTLPADTSMNPRKRRKRVVSARAMRERADAFDARMHSLHHTETPDLDNLIKAVKDAMSDARIWTDDRQVSAYGRMTKEWGTTPGARIAIEELPK